MKKILSALAVLALVSSVDPVFADDEPKDPPPSTDPQKSGDDTQMTDDTAETTSDAAAKDAGEKAPRQGQKGDGDKTGDATK